MSDVSGVGLQENFGLAFDAAKSFNESESENNFYRGSDELSKALQTAVLGVYERKVVPLEEERDSLKLDALLGSVGIENASATERWLIGEVESWMKNSRADHENKMPEGWALLLADLDGLKQINGEDSQGVKRGHDMGNAALSVLGRSLTTVSRVEDKNGRIGGDEFLVVMPAKKEVVNEMMEGDKGVISRLREKVAQGREELKNIFKDRWPDDTQNRKLGEVSVGWDYLTRDEIIIIYQEFKATPKENLDTNFTHYLCVLADKKLFKDKLRYSESV